MNDKQAELQITLNEFTDWLVKVGRDSGCPVCPHEGNWNFFIDNRLGLGPESYMTIFTMDSNSPDGSAPEKEVNSYYSMECPNCGYTILTGAKIVAMGTGRITDDADE